MAIGCLVCIARWVGRTHVRIERKEWGEPSSGAARVRLYGLEVCGGTRWVLMRAAIHASADVFVYRADWARFAPIVWKADHGTKTAAGIIRQGDAGQADPGRLGLGARISSAGTGARGAALKMSQCGRESRWSPHSLTRCDSLAPSGSVTFAARHGSRITETQWRAERY
jgi:hypothetical protein